MRVLLPGTIVKRRTSRLLPRCVRASRSRSAPPSAKRRGDPKPDGPCGSRTRAVGKDKTEAAYAHTGPPASGGAVTHQAEARIGTACNMSVILCRVRCGRHRVAVDRRGG